MIQQDRPKSEAQKDMIVEAQGCGRSKNTPGKYITFEKQYLIKHTPTRAKEKLCYQNAGNRYQSQN